MSLENWLLLLTSLSAVVWPAVAVGAYASYRRCRAVTPARTFARDPRKKPRVSVVLYARNERAHVETTLRSLLLQQGVVLEVIVVDDGSRDGTAELVAALAQHDARILLVKSPEHKAGWLRKTAALHHGAACATGQYILFTDAGVNHKRGSLLAAVRELEEHDLALLSLLPSFRWESLWENAAAPAFLLALTNFLSAPMHDPESEDALAFGAFILVEADAYRALGGHGAVHECVFADVALARHFKASGQRTAFRVAPHCLSVRMYRGARGVFEGCVKSCLAMFGDNMWLAVPLAITFGVAGVSLLVAPFVGLITLNPLLTALGLAVYFEVWLALVLARAYMKTHLAKLAAWFVGAPLLLGAGALALFRAAFYGSFLWRERAVHVAE